MCKLTGVQDIKPHASVPEDRQSWKMLQLYQRQTFVFYVTVWTVVTRGQCLIPTTNVINFGSNSNNNKTMDIRMAIRIRIWVLVGEISSGNSNSNKNKNYFRVHVVERRDRKTDRRTCAERPLRCPLFSPERQEHLTRTKAHGTPA
jgi:hypothetical protein